MRDNFTTLIGAGWLACPQCQTDLSTLPWNPHPTFPGVALRHLVTGADTDGRLSAHLVRIEAGCELKVHTHPGSLELHEVAAGAGTCTLAEKSVRYEPGVCGLIPAGTPHSVRADAGQDLYLLAKFAPALL
jgi:quercetin dioxygenase-like cupin family protein